MPMYEYYCKPCHTIFSFLSRTATVTRKPSCPRCGGDMQKQISPFAFSQKMKGAEKLPFPSQQAEEGVRKLKNEIDRMKSEETPQRAEQFKKNFERWSGVKLDHAVSTLHGVDLAPEKDEAPDQEGTPPERDPAIYEL